MSASHDDATEAGASAPLPNALDANGVAQGLWSEPDPHGGVMRGEYRDGLRQGVWQHLATDGRLRAEGGYLDGEVHGAWVWYRANGGLMQRGEFERGVKHGLWERWSASGSALDRGRFDQGRKAGEWVVFDADGGVRRRTAHRE